MNEIGKLLRAARPYRGWVYLGLLLSFVSVAAELMVPLFAGYAIDAVIGQGNVDFARVAFWLVPMLLAALVSSVGHHYMHRVTNRAAISTGRDLRRALSEKLMRLPLSESDKLSRGETLNLVTADIEKITDGLTQAFSELVGGIFAILGTLTLIFILNVYVALAVLVLTPLSILVARFITSRSHRLFADLADTRAALSGYTEEHFAGQREIMSFGREADCFAAFEEKNRDLRKKSAKAHFYGAMVNPVTRFVNGLVYAAVAVCGGLGAAGFGIAISVGELSCLLAYVHQYTSPFNNISVVMAEIELARASAKRLFKVLELPEESPDIHDGIVPKSVGAVTFSDVSFSYDKERPVIAHFSLDVAPGQCIAIVGQTGAGKTTLMNLLMRFYEPDAGDILFDGVPQEKLSRARQRSLFGMVLQEPWLFSGTVRENIAYGKPDAGDEEIRQAAAAAGAQGFIERLPQGYDTPVRAEEDALSAGQKQLLCLARVFLIKPKMLILDEATSNVDTRSERKIRAAFDRLMAGKTSFVVAHRLSTVQHADRILVLQNGAVVESGTHAELLRLHGAYERLYQSSFISASFDNEAAI